MSTTTRYITCAATAVELRKALKEAFPGTIFGVRSKTYSGGASINISYVDGPAYGEVNAVAQKFSGALFDGMTDMKSYRAQDHNGEAVHWGADFVFLNQSISFELFRSVEKRLLDMDACKLSFVEVATNMGSFGRYANPQPMTKDHFDWREFVTKAAKLHLQDALPTGEPSSIAA